MLLSKLRVVPNLVVFKRTLVKRPSFPKPKSKPGSRNFQYYYNRLFVPFVLLILIQVGYAQVESGYKFWVYDKAPWIQSGVEKIDSIYSKFKINTDDDDNDKGKETVQQNVSSDKLVAEVRDNLAKIKTSVQPK